MEGSNQDLCERGTGRLLYVRRSQETNTYFFVKQIPIKDTWVSIQRVHTGECPKKTLKEGDKVKQRELQRSVWKGFLTMKSELKPVQSLHKSNLLSNIPVCIVIQHC